MAINIVERIKALSSIYSDDRKERELEVHYSLPNNGVNEKTGFLVYIAGFRGHCNANVFKKLRKTFADKYNLVVVQCDYFGNEFMQKASHMKLLKKHLEVFEKDEIIKLYKGGKFEYDKYMELCEKYNVRAKVREVMDETVDNFNEMGLMQALDNISALQYVARKLERGGAKFNGDKVIFYGNSHGSYLCHLCNILTPDMISLIIDNSGWTFPEHINQDRRVLTLNGKNSLIKVIFDYIARDILDDFEILDLNNLYKDFENKCKILGYHGSADHLISLEDKTAFMKKINNTELIAITEENVDGEIFSNYKHGLGANFLKLFDSVMERDDIIFKQSEEGEQLHIPKGRYLQSEKYHYVIDYKGQYPVLARAEK